MLRFVPKVWRDRDHPSSAFAAPRARIRGASTLWSVVLVAACAAFLGVTMITYWVSSRGGYVDRAPPAQPGIARIARAAAQFDPNAGQDAGAPPVASAVASAKAPPEPAGAPAAANETPDAGGPDLDEEDEPAPRTAGGHTSPTAPKTTSKKRRLRPRLKRH